MTTPANPVLHFYRTPLNAGEAVRYWRLGDIAAEPYDAPDVAMAGEMDPFFFLTKDKNVIPHEYPCRTEFAAERRDKRPEVVADAAMTRWWLPFGSPRVDLSGFWYRATVIGCRAETYLDAEAAGVAVLRLGTCGGAVLMVNGVDAGWMAPYARNREEKREFTVTLEKGLNRIEIAFDDLAERDVRFFFQLDYVSGPAVTVAMPAPVEGPVVAALEALLEGMRFERIVYTGGEVAMLFPGPLPDGVVVRAEVEGDLLTGEQIAVPATLRAYRQRLNLGPADALPADFREFTVTLEVDGFAVYRAIGVEICHADRQGPAPASLMARIDEALGEVAAYSERDTMQAFACLALGRSWPDVDAMIEAALPAIENCHDCADFMLVPLLWVRAAWGDVFETDTRGRVDRAILGYRYWMDEPGNDVQWYFSENHALLFHTAAYLAGHLFPDATFARSRRTGREQSAVGAARVRAWLDHFERWEMAEFNSAPYFPIDLKGLTALMAMAPDADIRERARKGIVRLCEIVARSAHHGIVTAAQGRSYEHSLLPVHSLELSAVSRLLWGKGRIGRRVHVLPMLAVCIRDHGLALPAEIGATADYSGDDAIEWRFAQGQDRIAKLYHYKTRNVAMGSAATYRWNEWGYQETVLHLRLGTNPAAQVWINHPGETIQFGHGRPSYWGGSGMLPRAHQYRGLAVLDYAIADEQPDFTHAWFPRAAFDTSAVSGQVAVAQSGGGLALLKGSGDLALITKGPTYGVEVRLPGRHSRWIVRIGDAETEGDMLAFETRYGALAVEDIGDDLVVIDPTYGKVIFRFDGSIEAEGRRLNPADWTISGESQTLPRGRL